MDVIIASLSFVALINFIVWPMCFGVRFGKLNKKYMIFDAVGGSGKTTLAQKMKLPIISGDKLKYKKGWERYSFNEYTDSLYTAAEQYSWVYEGTFSDPRAPAQQGVLTELARKSGATVIILDLPLWCVLWRKGFRSFKRKIGLEPQGAGGPETLWNIREMLQKAWVTYSSRRKELLDLYKDSSIHTVWISWPYSIAKVE